MAATLLKDRYALLKPLGQGTSGVTFLARDTLEGVEVAIKRFHVQQGAVDAGSWTQEAAILRSLHHPNIPRYLDHFTYEDTLVQYPCLVQSYVEGVSLRTRAEQARHTPDEVLAFADEILQILAYLQSLSPPVVHRDIKPGNLLQDPSGALHLIDFGTAVSAVTQTFGHTLAVGTLGYQAPEQIQGEPLPCSDVYSVGVLCLELLTQQAPKALLAWDGSLGWQRKAGHMPPELRAWLEQMLAPVGTRFSSAAQALAALAPLRGGAHRAQVPAPSFEGAAVRASYDETLAAEHRKAAKLTEAADSLTDWLDAAQSWQRLHDGKRLADCLLKVRGGAAALPVVEQCAVLDRALRHLGEHPVLAAWLAAVEAAATTLAERDAVCRTVLQAGQPDRHAVLHGALQADLAALDADTRQRLRALGVPTDPTEAPAESGALRREDVEALLHACGAHEARAAQAQDLDARRQGLGLAAVAWQRPVAEAQLAQAAADLDQQEDLAARARRCEDRTRQMGIDWTPFALPLDAIEVGAREQAVADHEARYQPWEASCQQLEDEVGWSPPVPSATCSQEEELLHLGHMREQLGFSARIEKRRSALQARTDWAPGVPAFPMDEDRFEAFALVCDQQQAWDGLVRERWAELGAHSRAVVVRPQAPYTAASIARFEERCARYRDKATAQRARMRRDLSLLGVFLGVPLLGVLIHQVPLHLQARDLTARAAALDWTVDPVVPYSSDALDALEDQVLRSEALHPRIVDIQDRAAPLGWQTAFVAPYCAVGSSEVCEANVARFERRFERRAALVSAGMEPAQATLLAQVDTVLVPAGSFTMGCSGPGCPADAGPAHAVTLTAPLAFMQTEVTQALYTQVMGANPSTLTGCGVERADDTEETRVGCPVDSVSWYGAVVFANRLSEQTGLQPCYTVGSGSVAWADKACTGWRLPTEAEWEHAARGDEAHRFAGSDDIDAVGWVLENNEGKSRTVCEKRPNGFGLCDMSGNLWEWCWDTMGPYPAGPQVDPVRDVAGAPRVYRGGGWSDKAPRSGVAARYGYDATFRFPFQGFRLVRRMPSD